MAFVFDSALLLTLFFAVILGTVHFLRGRGAGGIWGGHQKKTALKGGASKKNKGKGGSRKILPLLEGGSWEKI